MMDQAVYGHQQTLFIPITHNAPGASKDAGVSVLFVFNAELKPLRNKLFLMKQKDADEYADNVVGGSEDDDVSRWSCCSRGVSGRAGRAALLANALAGEQVVLDVLFLRLKTALSAVFSEPFSL
ncbi:hypothetical protein PPTG_19014 [Phytophthora nicotianae INRA-310]|uniref:Uncharacterized protein n=1 Tax=Phytophthora nicotianae (strain INRA-310) TaxID=761204 RepID=W2PFJ6_PHYN3|nr:hypothetical protein PPTG_19014 [Phytophthora nicotianae INRA-310]ETM98993.1 hypothetical protein PPTG_19014 [Phytophthora nicotianae INRA-310]